MSILRLKDVIARTGLSRPTIYRWIKLGIFPAQVQLGPNSIGWRESDIQTWIASREPRPAS